EESIGRVDRARGVALAAEHEGSAARQADVDPDGVARGDAVHPVGPIDALDADDLRPPCGDRRDTSGDGHAGEAAALAAETVLADLHGLPADEQPARLVLEDHLAKMRSLHHSALH